MEPIVSKKARRAKPNTTLLTTDGGEIWGIVCQGYDTPEKALRAAIACWIDRGHFHRDAPTMKDLSECEYWRWIPTPYSDFDVTLMESKKGSGAFRAHVFDLYV